MSLAGSLWFVLGWLAAVLHFHKKTPAPAEVTGSRGDTQIRPAQITRLRFRGKVVEHEMRHVVPRIRADKPAPLRTYTNM